MPGDSTIASVADLAGKHIAATIGTDPYFFLLQSLEEAGVPLDSVTIENLQHADGWAALQNGSVDAWAGLDPIMAGAEAAGAKLLYRNVGFNSYGFLNATESFLASKPDVAQIVVDAYEHARAWAALHPDRDRRSSWPTSRAWTSPIATKVIDERTNLDVDPVPGAAQLAVLQKIGPIFVTTGRRGPAVEHRRRPRDDRERHVRDARPIRASSRDRLSRHLPPGWSGRWIGRAWAAGPRSS